MWDSFFRYLREEPMKKTFHIILLLSIVVCLPVYSLIADETKYGLRHNYIQYHFNHFYGDYFHRYEEPYRLAPLLFDEELALGSFSGIFLDFRPSFSNFQFRGNIPYYYIALGFMIFSVIAVRLIETSKLGRFIVAIREDEDAAQALGVNSFKYNMIAIAISAFMTSLAGTFYANYIFFLVPASIQRPM